MTRPGEVEVIEQHASVSKETLAGCLTEVNDQRRKSSMDSKKGDGDCALTLDCSAPIFPDEHKFALASKEREPAKAASTAPSETERHPESVEARL